MKVLEKLKKELSDFEQYHSLRPGEDSTSDIRYGGSKDKGYLYNQKAVIDLTDQYFRSQFTKSKIDDEGQRMIFVNQIQFPVRVARKQVDIDFSDIILVPDTYQDARKIKFVKRQFLDWGKESQFGQVINELLDDYTKYGTCVYKRVGDEIERQPLHNLINSYNAYSLKDAATSGGYVIIKHELYPNEIKKMPDWNLDGLDLDINKQYCVYERYALISGKDMNEYQEDTQYEDDEQVFGMSVVVEEIADGETYHKVVFIEELAEDEFPLGEAHWEREHGRWLGIGESENQFENQVAKNLSVNLRRRALQWASKKIFQSSDMEKDGLNLIKEVKDGTVLEVGRDGAITQVNSQTQHLGDFQAFEAMIDNNSQQKSFTFESATGETLPSGTPFRLGVVLSQATNTHFNLKKENFALMLDRMFFNHIVDIFKNTPKKKRLSYAADEEGVEELRESIVESKASQILKDALLKSPLDEVLGTRFDKETVKNRIREKIAKEPYFFVNIPDKYYDDLQFAMTVEVVGQNVNIDKEVETLSNLLQLTIGNPQALNDPRISKILELILAKTGQSLGSVLGSMAQQSPEMAGLANDAISAQALSGNLNFNGGINQQSQNVAE